MDLNILSKSLLFHSMPPNEIEEMLDCLGTEQKHFAKGSFIYHAGQTISAMGMVLSGSINIENDDLWGNNNILDHVVAGQIFAETYACIPSEPLMVSVVTAEPTEILFLNASRLLQICPNNCPYHNKLIRNLLSITARKNLNLSQRISHTSPKSIRGRLISYLSFQAAKFGRCQFTIPFNRQQLANYLGVDRSAMSHELSKMQRDGLLSIDKNTFHLKEISH